MATHATTLAWEILGTEEPRARSPQDCKELNTTEHSTEQGIGSKSDDLTEYFQEYKLVTRFQN